MSLTVPTEELPAPSPFRLSSSTKWLAQVALLFGLLLLGRWRREEPVPLAAAASSITPPVRSAEPRNPMAEPYTTVSNATFLSAE